jgi:hypothetical protein
MSEENIITPDIIPDNIVTIKKFIKKDVKNL